MQTVLIQCKTNKAPHLVRVRATRAHPTPGRIERFAGAKDVCLVDHLSHRRGPNVRAPVLAAMNAYEQIVKRITVRYNLARTNVACMPKLDLHPRLPRSGDTAVDGETRGDRWRKTPEVRAFIRAFGRPYQVPAKVARQSAWRRNPHNLWVLGAVIANKLAMLNECADEVGVNVSGGPASTGVGV